MCKQDARVPRVLRRDEIHRAQRLHRAVGHIAEVADGRRAEVERSLFRHVDPSILYSLLCVIADAPPVVKRKLCVPQFIAGKSKEPERPRMFDAFVPTPKEYLTILYLSTLCDFFNLYKTRNIVP